MGQVDGKARIFVVITAHGVVLPGDGGQVADGIVTIADDAAGRVGQGTQLSQAVVAKEQAAAELVGDAGGQNC